MPSIEKVEAGFMSYEPAVQWPDRDGPQIATIVRVRTAGGIEGVSVTWNDSPASSLLASTVHAWFAERLAGCDVRLHPASTEALFKQAAWNGVSCVALAAMDNALWDAKAKAYGLPLHAVLGSRHEKLPIYAGSRAELGMSSFEAVADHIAEAREAGYAAYKLHLWGGAERDIAGCEFIRNRFGDDQRLMFDPLGRYSPGESLQVARVLERLGFEWFEDPLPAEQRNAYRWLAQRVDIPLVAADSLQWSWNDYLEAATTHTPIMLRLDAGRQGITFTSEMIAIANAHGVRCEIHAFGPEANSVAGLHTALAQKPLSYYEGCFPRRSFEIPGIEVPTHHDRDGHVAAPDAPGLGLDCDWTYLDARTTWMGRPY